MKNIAKLLSCNQREATEVLKNVICDWCGALDSEGSYIYDLTRVKSAFKVGTMTMDDFEEWDSKRSAEVADDLAEWLYSESD